MRQFVSRTIAPVALAAAVLAGCAADQSTSSPESDEIDCTENEYYDQVSDECVPRFPSQDDDDSPALDANSSADGGDVTADTPRGDAATDADETNPDTKDATPKEDTRNCDKDRDRAKAKACGGNDCDDNDPRRSPHIAERCDTIDNNCSGEVNDGIDCTFYAHEGDTLYKVNPFQKTANEVGGNLPGLHDLDTHPDGTLYGVTPGGFYRFDSSSNSWNELKAFSESASWSPSDPNGLAIDREGRIFITSQDTLYSVDKRTQDGATSWWVEKVGTMGTTSSGTAYRSSGDAVVNKTTLYMTSKHDPDEDHLVTLAPDSGTASDATPIGYDKVFGLTTAWGTLYGLTNAGELIEIDPQSGKSSLVHTFDQSWFGAASTPRRQPRK